MISSDVECTEKVFVTVEDTEGCAVDSEDCGVDSDTCAVDSDTCVVDSDNCVADSEDFIVSEVVEGASEVVILVSITSVLITPVVDSDNWGEVKDEAETVDSDDNIVIDSDVEADGITDKLEALVSSVKEVLEVSIVVDSDGFSNDAVVSDIPIVELVVCSIVDVYVDVSVIRDSSDVIDVADTIYNSAEVD